MFFPNNLLALISQGQKAADQSPEDSRINMPPLVLQATAFPGVFQTPAYVANGGDAYHGAAQSFIAWSDRARSNQAAAESNPFGLGPGVWDVDLEAYCSWDWALQNAFYIRIFEAQGPDTWYLFFGDNTGQGSGTWQKKFRWNIPNRQDRGAIVYGNEWSIIFGVPAAGVGQNNYMALSISAAKIL